MAIRIRRRAARRGPESWQAPVIRERRLRIGRLFSPELAELAALITGGVLIAVAFGLVYLPAGLGVAGAELAAGALAHNRGQEPGP